MWFGSNEDLPESELRHLTEKYSEYGPIQSADPVSVRLRGAFVSDSYDLGGENDVMIVVKFQFDDQPPIDRLLYFEPGIEPGWYDDFFDEIVLSTNDFSYKTVTINVQVYDIDHLSFDSETVEQVQNLVERAAPIITFLPLAKYAGVIDIALEPIIKTANLINDHEPIIDNRVTLEIGEESNTGHDLLQPGYLVCFERGPDISPKNEEYKLNPDTKVTGPEGVYTESSYVVLEVERERMYTSEREINQKASKLMSELDGRGQSETEAIEYLRQTLRGYNRYKKLNRTTELISKESLTESEQRLLDRLKSDDSVQELLDESSEIIQPEE